MSEQGSISSASGQHLYGGTYSWQQYAAQRPAYPQHVLDSIIAHHAANGNQWELAADFGTGMGTLVPFLLQKFQHVSASDVNEAQINEARQHFEKLIDKQQIPSSLDFHVAKAEEPHPWLPEGSVDLCIAGEAVHWFNAKEWMARCARLLRPGGTVAFLLYPPTSTIISNPKASTCLSNVLVEGIGSALNLGIKKVFASAAQELKFDPALFEHESRIHYILPNGLRDPCLIIGEQQGLNFAKLDNTVQFREEPVIKRGCTVQDVQDYYQTVAGMPENVMNLPAWQKTLNTIEDEVRSDKGVFDMAWPIWLCMASKR